MSQVDWTKIQYFAPSEFDDPTAPGTGLHGMQKEIVAPLDYIRSKCGFPLIVQSGFRTVAHNTAVGGEDNSAHLHGYAADIKCLASRTRFKILYFAKEIGLTRIGIGKTFVHLDASPSLPQEVEWLY